MIAKTDAKAVLEKNLERTESLIVAMDKIYGYNRIYRENLHETLTSKPSDNPIRIGEEEFQRLKITQELVAGVKDVQDRELERIKRSCGEHAIISLATAFETYYKELVQELLNLAPNFFISTETLYTKAVCYLVKNSMEQDYETISKILKLRNRWDYYKFFDAYSIPFLSSMERDFIERIYTLRNNFVHNAGKEDSKSRMKTDVTYEDQYISTNAKRMRTQFKKIMFKFNDKLRIQFKSTSC